MAGLAVAAAALWPLRGYITDDTFIHLQDARHRAAGQGPVFNVDERVYGCTSPLWVGWSAAAMRLGIDGLGWAKATGWIATLASVAVFLQLIRRSVPSPAVRAAATVAWAGHAWMLRWALSGMETPLAVLLVLGGFAAHAAESTDRPRGPWPGVLWGLAALVRPEAALLLLAFSVARIASAARYGGARATLAILPGAAVLSGWLVFAQLYFGTIWPQTLAAKAAGAAGLAVAIEGAQRALELFLATDAALAVTLALALVLGGARARSGARTGIAWIWLLVLPTTYVARGVP